MSDLQNGPKLSICAPCYNEQEVLPEFYKRASAAAAAAASAGDYELILVDDGSSDGTWRLIEQLAGQDRRVIGARLMRNQGHQAAATAALSLARGSCVMLIDADLQDPPELLGDMMRMMEAGADVVYGQRVTRESESWFKKSSASAFYRLLSRLASVAIPRDTGDFRLMSRRIVDALAVMPERQRFIRGMVSWIGGVQTPLPYHREARFAGVSKYPISKMVRFAVDAITSFSAVPLRIATYLGLITVFFSLLLLAYTVWRWIGGDTVVGWSSVMTAITMFSAVQLIVLGIMGEYIGRLFQEVKGRPGFLFDRIIVGDRVHGLPLNFCNMAPSERRRALGDTFGSEPPALRQRTN